MSLPSVNSFPAFSGADWVFVDTQIFTLFPLIEKADAFRPPERADRFPGDPPDLVVFMLCMPVLRELERIKNDHPSRKQQDRVRRVLQAFSDSDDYSHLGVQLTEASSLSLRPSDVAMPKLALPTDDQLIELASDAARYREGRTFVLSDDLGVRLRARTEPKLRPYKPHPDLRFPSPKNELSQDVKRIVRELASALSAEYRFDEEEG